MPMTLAEAIAIVDKGIAKAKQMNLAFSLAVVDEYGQLVQLDRMDGASLMSPDVAQGKAITALNFRRPTSQLAANFRDRQEALRAIQSAVHFNIMALGGGVPVMKDGRVYGAIGVSGGTAEQDEEVAAHAVS